MWCDEPEGFYGMRWDLQWCCAFGERAGNGEDDKVRRAHVEDQRDDVEVVLECLRLRVGTSSTKNHCQQREERPQWRKRSFIESSQHASATDENHRRVAHPVVLLPAKRHREEQSEQRRRGLDHLMEAGVDLHQGEVREREAQSAEY